MCSPASFACVVAVSLLAGCSSAQPSGGKSRDTNAAIEMPTVPVVESQPKIREQSVAGPLLFEEVAESLGVRFQHYSPLTPQRHIHLFMGSGIGWLDFDRDGWPDLYCCQGAALEGSTPQANQTSDAFPSNRLFQNHQGSFADVTRSAGLLDVGYSVGYSMGVAAADYDNDGFADLCITGYGENALWRNNGDGSFTRVPLPLERLPGRLSASCTWGDVDGDGNLDLYVTNYAQLGPADYPTCQHTVGDTTIAISCHPANLQHVSDLLYRNTGTGEFEEISADAGIAAGTPQPGLGVIAADLDNDGDVDFYVANDTTPNQLWVNQGDGRFVDRGADAGVARNRDGACEAGMGIAVGDVDGNGRTDLFVTNYYKETNTLYRNEGELLFADVTDELGLGAPSLLRLGFGTSLADFDRDGWLDLMVANGHVQDLLHKVKRDEPFAQLPLLFHNQRGRRFQDVSATAGSYFSHLHVGRSTATADFDRDGDVDLAVNGLNESAALLRNESASTGHWLRVELVGVQSNRGGVGAVLELDLGERKLVRSLHAGSGYLSSDEATMLIGLGPSDVVRGLTANWPIGRRETWSALPADRLWRLVEGTGTDAGAMP